MYPSPYAIPLALHTPGLVDAFVLVYLCTHILIRHTLWALIFIQNAPTSLSPQQAAGWPTLSSGPSLQQWNGKSVFRGAGLVGQGFSERSAMKWKAEILALRSLGDCRLGGHIGDWILLI